MSALEMDRPPESIDAERAVIGSTLEQSKCFARVRGTVSVETFHGEAHRLVWRTIERLAIAGQGFDLFGVREALTARELDRVGGVAYLASLLDHANPAEVERFAAVVREKAEARGIFGACRAAMREIVEGTPAPTVASSLRHVLASVGTPQERRSRGIGDVALEVRKHADERAAAGHSLGVRTGRVQFDKRTGGYRRKALSLIAARSSHGKTALMVDDAIGAVATDPNVRVALYSLEMDREPMVNIIRSILTKIPLQRISEWETLPSYDRDIVLGIDEFLMNEWNDRLYFNDSLSDVDEVCADARRLKEERGLDAVFVDYLQLLSGFKDERNRERVVNQLGKQVFDLAKQIDVATIALSQVTRPGFDRLGIEDLRESKAIGHDAWLVLMLNRPWQAHKDDSMNLPCDATLQIEKNRGGRTGDIALHFDGAVQTFTEDECSDNCRDRRRRDAR
jgi:replicative DNA helicase